MEPFFFWSLECELVDCSLFLLVALLFARIRKISRKDNYWSILGRCYRSPACAFYRIEGVRMLSVALCLLKI